MTNEEFTTSLRAILQDQAIKWCDKMPSILALIRRFKDSSPNEKQLQELKHALSALLKGNAIPPLDPNMANLVEAVELLMFISNDLFPLLFSHTIESVHFRELEAKLPNGDLIASQFIAKLKSAHYRKQLGLVWSLLDTAPADDKVRLGYTTAQIQQYEIEQAVSQIDVTELIAKTQAQLPYLEPKLIQDLIASGHDFFTRKRANPRIKLNIEATLENKTSELSIFHLIILAFWQDNVCYINRAQSDTIPPGISLYKANEAQQQNIYDHFYTNIDPSKWPNGRQLFKYLDQNLKLDFRVPMKMQGPNICAWVTAKTSYWAAVYFGTLDYFDQNPIPNLDHKLIAQTIALIAYKNVSELMRRKVIEDYLKYEPDYDIELLEQLKAKLKSETWQKRGLAEFEHKIPRQTFSNKP